MEMTKMMGLWYVLPTGSFPFDETQREKFSPILQAIIEHIGFWSKELTIHFWIPHQEENEEAQWLQIVEVGSSECVGKTR